MTNILVRQLTNLLQVKMGYVQDRPEKFPLKLEHLQDNDDLLTLHRLNTRATVCCVPLKPNLQEVELQLFHLPMVQIAQDVGTYSVKPVSDEFKLFNLLKISHF